MQNFEERIAELEMKITFQDSLLEELNHALVQQQFVIDRMQVQLRHVAAKLKDMQPSNIAGRLEETPPPHY